MSFKTAVSFISVCIFYCFQLTVFAADTNSFNSSSSADIQELPPLQVQSLRTDKPLEKYPTSKTIITRKEIERTQHFQVEDILRENLGLDVVQNGPPGTNTSVFLRGTGSSSTLVLVDGVQVNSNTTGGFNFSDLNMDNIERIEILRGPQSTLWGADAVGGVINVVTRKGRGKPEHYFSFEGGSFSTFKETAGSSGAIGDFDYSVTASITDSEGFSAASKNRGNTEEDGYDATNFSTRTGYNFTEDTRAEFIARYTDATVEFDAFGPVDNFQNQTDRQSIYLSLPIQSSINEWWKVKLNPNMSIDELDGFSSGSAFKIFNRTYTLDLQNNVKINDIFSAVVGFEYQAQNGENPGSNIRRNLYNQGYYLQGIMDFQDRIFITAGFRHDVNSIFEDPTTYKIEGAYSFHETGTRLRVNYGTGFRAPTFNDLFFPGFSNPDLKPEKNKSWEVGVDQSLLGDQLFIAVTYFDSDLEDLIQFDNTLFIPINIGNATSKGIETFIRWNFYQHFNLSLSHTWNQTQDGNGSPLRRRAKNKFTATLSHNWNDKLDSLVSVTTKSAIRDGSNGDVGAYAVVRLAAAYKILDNLKLTARIENLLDENYEDLPGFGTAGVSGYAGFKYTFN